MKHNEGPLRSKLDWSKLLGFDQADRGETGKPESGEAVKRLADPRMAKIGGKVGAKPGFSFRR